MSTSLHADTAMTTSLQRVWVILTDFPAYPTWNLFIHRIAGQRVTGARLEVPLAPQRSRGMSLRAGVLDARLGRTLRWLGHLRMRGLFGSWLRAVAGREPSSPSRTPS